MLPQISQNLNYSSFEQVQKIWANWLNSIVIFTKKIVTKLSEYGSGIQIQDPEKSLSRIQGQKAPDPGSRICNTGILVLL
jgi:hypothetical protein